MVIPGVIVSGVDARHLLLELSFGGASVSLNHVAEYAPTETANVIGVIPRHRLGSQGGRGRTLRHAARVPRSL